MAGQSHYTREQFHQLAQGKGLDKRKIRRLIENRLFPRTRKVGLGHARGCKYEYPGEALGQLEELVRFRVVYPDFSELRWRLWLESEGWEWLWKDLLKELLSDWMRKPDYNLNRDSDRNKIDRRVQRSLLKFSRARHMSADNVSSVLWAGIYLLFSGQPYVDEDGNEFWRPLFRQFYGDEEADSLVKTFAPWLARDKVQFILENATEYFAASVRAEVMAELRLGLPQMPVRKTRKAEMRQLKCLVVSSLVLQFILVCSLRNNPEIQKAGFEWSCNNAVAVLVTPDGAAHGKDNSECKEIVTEEAMHLKTPIPP